MIAGGVLLFAEAVLPGLIAGSSRCPAGVRGELSCPGPAMPLPPVVSFAVPALARVAS